MRSRGEILRAFADGLKTDQPKAMDVIWQNLVLEVLLDIREYLQDRVGPYSVDLGGREDLPEESAS